MSEVAMFNVTEPCPDRPRYLPLKSGGFAVRKWDHDCLNCQLVGHKGDTDVYLCRNHKFTSVVIRNSDDPPDYWSSSLVPTRPVPHD